MHVAVLGTIARLDRHANLAVRAHITGSELVANDSPIFMRVG